MSRTHRQPFTPSQGTAASSLKSKEQVLYVNVPPPDSDLPVERSRFSPDSPPERGFTLGRPIFFKSSPRLRPLDLEKGSASHSSSSQRTKIGERFDHFVVDLRGGSRRDDPSVRRAAPIVTPSPSKMPAAWRQLDGERRQEVQCMCHAHAQPPPTGLQTRYGRALLSALVVFLLYLFINVIILNARSFTPMHVQGSRLSTSSPPSTSAAPTGNTLYLSADTQQCVTQYTLDAPGDPRGYPCGTCLSLLAAVPPNATSVYAVARDGTQFCGLRSVWEDAGQQGQAALEAGGWVEDVKFCTWNGVQCDGAGRVSSLQLTSPAIPASIPVQMTNLTSLESLEIIGSGNSPAGLFPTTFGALNKLTSLHLENTALGALPDTLQTLTSLTLVRNAQLGSSLPPSIGGDALNFLIVNNETLTLSKSQTAALCGGRQLQSCDLRGSGIQACGACLVG
ncbi:hypothetical protein BC827DRAFT_1184525 [Russula dissimulans]|nr:hypothetical protein BC827DRAFT_1184525 [Russula dissimulans]